MRTAGVSHTTIKPQWPMFILVFKNEFYIWKQLEIFVYPPQSFSLSGVYAAQGNDQSLAFWSIERPPHYISCHIHDRNVLADFVTLGRKVSCTWGRSSNTRRTEIHILAALVYVWSDVLSTTDRIQKHRNVNGQLTVKNCSTASSGAEQRICGFKNEVISWWKRNWWWIEYWGRNAPFAKIISGKKLVLKLLIAFDAWDCCGFLCNGTYMPIPYVWLLCCYSYTTARRIGIYRHIPNAMYSL